MKKYIVSLVAIVAGFSVASAASTASITVAPLSSATVLSGGAKVSQLVVQANTATNTSVTFIDAPTNSFLYTNAAYVSTTSYATNLIWGYTNYWGAVTSVTNLVLVDINVTNAATANAYPTRTVASALASTSTRADNVNYQFLNGVQVTNTSTGSAIVTVTFIR